MAITGYFLDRNWNYREVLLGFEPVSGSHSGANLSSILLGLLHQHRITNRVLSVTADNATNNNTLMSIMRESIQALRQENQVPIIRVPCLAHVIQLSLKQLLGGMKANPRNEAPETIQSDNHSRELPVRQDERDIVDTLNKV